MNADSVCCQQNDPRALRKLLWRRMSPSQRFQFPALLGANVNRYRGQTWHGKSSRAVSYLWSIPCCHKFQPLTPLPVQDVPDSIISHITCCAPDAHGGPGPNGRAFSGGVY